ncbi:putative transcription factor VOZ1/VOZ2 [Helianthus debilis subsp. tardiflorus]
MDRVLSQLYVRGSVTFFFEFYLSLHLFRVLSGLHAVTAQNEGQFGMAPVFRPKGIELKDSLLFDALSAKSHGKDVVVPECEGAATAKSPWNATELFDLSVV